MWHMQEVAWNSDDAADDDDDDDVIDDVNNNDDEESTMQMTAVAKNWGATPGPESRSAIHLCHLNQILHDDDDPW